MTNTFQLAIDWNNDLDFNDTGEDVTSRVFADEVTVHRGKDDARTLSPSTPGSISFGLSNTSRDYYPDNASSPIFGNIGPGRRIRFRCFDTADTTFALDVPFTTIGTGVVASCPDTAALSFAGDIDLRMKLTPEYWSGGAGGGSSIMLRKGVPGTLSWRLELSDAGFLILTTSPDGTAEVVATSTLNVMGAGIKHGQTYWIRATRDMDNGAAGNTTAFYTSPDGSAWTALGSSVIIGGTTTSFNGTQTVDICAGLSAVRVHTIQVREGIAGTVRADPDFTSAGEGWQPGDDAGDTGSDGVNTWTLANEATIGIRPMFGGVLDEFATVPYPADDEPQVALSGVGLLNRLHGVHVDGGAVPGVLTSTAAYYVLNLAGIVGEAFASGGNDSSTVIDYFHPNGDAWELLQQLVNSEGPGAMVYEDGYGRIHWRGRHSHATHYPSITSQITFDDTTEPHFEDLLDDRGWRDVVNHVAIPVKKRTISDIGVVWRADGNISLGASEARSYTFTSPDPFYSLLTPVVNTDYFLISGAVTPTLNVNGTSAVLTLTAGGGGCVIGPPPLYDSTTKAVVPSSGEVIFFLQGAGQSPSFPGMRYYGSAPSGLQVRGQVLTTVDSVTVEAEDTASQALYGVRSYNLDAPWMNENTARDVATMIVNHYKSPLPTVTLTFNDGNTDSVRLTQMLEREIGDRVTVTDTDTGWNADVFIQSIEHQVADAGNDVTTVFTCEKAVTPLVADVDLFILDSSTNGVLGTDKLAH